MSASLGDQESILNPSRQVSSFGMRKFDRMHSFLLTQCSWQHGDHGPLFALVGTVHPPVFVAALGEHCLHFIRTARIALPVG